MKREVSYIVEGRPISWRRPNIVNGRPHTDAAQREAKRAHQYAALKVGAAIGGVDPESYFAVSVIAYYPDRNLGDVDRILGLPLDAMQGVIYANDRIVAEVSCRRRIDRERPRIEVTITRLRGCDL